jgi:hypothetical protein
VQGALALAGHSAAKGALAGRHLHGEKMKGSAAVTGRSARSAAGPRILHTGPAWRRQWQVIGQIWSLAIGDSTSSTDRSGPRGGR